MDGRVGVKEEAEDLVAHPEVADATAHLVDDAGVVAPERDRVVVVHTHLGEHARGDRVVDRVHRGGVDPYEHLVVGGGGLRHVLAEGGLDVGAVEGDGSHWINLLGNR